MNVIAPIAQSGMQAAQMAVRTHGHNLANSGTEPFRRQILVQSTHASGGTSVELGVAQEPGHDPLADLVGLQVAQRSFVANLSVFRTANQMTGTLLDAMA